MEITYKLLNKEDILKNKESLAEMVTKNLEENVSQSFPDDLGRTYVEKMPGYIEDGSAIIVGAFDGTKMVGFLWGYEVDIFGEKRVHNTENYVKDGYRRCGIAKRMLQCLEKEAVRRGIYILEAMCTASNENACRHYIHSGYETERIKFKKLLKD